MFNKKTKAGHRILLVNDELIDQKPVSEILEDAGYNIHISLNGKDMLNHLLQETFDLVVYDLMNSELSAIEILGQFRLTIPQKKTQLLFISDTMHDSICSNSINNKNIDFLYRPFGREELYRRINSRLDFHNAINEISEKKSIMESLQLAHTIQKSLLPDAEALNQAFSEHFVLDLPLKVVSGDFHWIRRMNNTVLFALADCTGHGFPAALMSVLGISLLNELTLESKLIKPNELLNKLRSRLNETLIKKGKWRNSLLGLDMIVASIDLDSGRMMFSGAYNSLYISRNGEIIEIKGDPQSLDLFPGAKPFGVKSFKLHPGDELYAASDGYWDQFGGRYGKKLQKKNFKSILEFLSGKSMHEQREILLETHLEWKGSHAQVDDILVIGLKI